MNNIGDFLQNVNLENYSSSPGWLGYSSLKHKATIKTCQNINMCFHNFIESHNNKDDVIIASSLELWGDLTLVNKEYDYPTGIDAEEILLPLIRLGLVSYYSQSFIDRYGITDDITHKKLPIGFYSILYEKELISNLNVMMMLLGGLNGHLFYILQDLGIVIYPHDDYCGFGFIKIQTTNFGLEQFMSYFPDELFEFHSSTSSVKQ